MKISISALTAIPELTPAAQDALKDHCHYLLSTLSTDYTELFADPALPGKQVSVAYLSDIAEDLGDARVIETHPVAAMVAAG